METEGIKLDEAVHALLKKRGYEYFLITSLQLSNGQNIHSVTVKAEKEIPAGMKYSCTGIDDPMITSFIYKKGLDCEIFVEPFD